MALLAKDTRDSLISWHDLIDLGWELKHQLRASQASMSKLMKTFDSVFSDELSEEPMRAPAMKIHLSLIHI